MNQESPLFSVIVTSYNYEDYIRNTLDSIVNQTFRDFEVIVVDDGSTDNSWQIIQEYAKNYSFIKVLCHQGRENRGISESIKLGLSVAKGEFIAFLESDDYWLTNHLAVKAAYLEANHWETKILFNGIKLLNGNKCINSYLENCEKKLTENNGKNIFKFMKTGNILPTFSAMAVQRKLLEGCDFNSPYAPWLDFWLWMQICFYHPVDFISEQLTCWR